MTKPESLKFAAPLELHEIDKKTRAGIESVVEKVVCRAAVDGFGKDLLLRIYLAGLYHGSYGRSLDDSSTAEILPEA